MPTGLLLLLCLLGHVFAKEPPDVNCLVVNLEYVHCSWNKQGTPEVNYTFYCGFKEISECTTYLSENNTNTGCKQPYGKILNRFNTFHTRLEHGNKISSKEFDLKDKVKLNPPTNQTVKNGSDSNLWFYWNQTFTKCVESEVRFKCNDKQWETDKVSAGKQSFCINLPSSTSKYELQVRSRVGDNCGESLFWSDWSEPVVWGSNNGTVPDNMNGLTSVWTPVLYAVGAITLILLVIMLLHYERVRILIIPVVPKPSLNHHEDWNQLSKVLKDTPYNERACPVREYCPISQSDSESSGDSSFSVTTDQTDCSVSIPVDEPDDLSTPCSSSTSTSTGLVSSEEAEQVSV